MTNEKQKIAPGQVEVKKVVLRHKRDIPNRLENMGISYTWESRKAILVKF